MPCAKNVGAAVLFMILACATLAEAQQSPAATNKDPEDVATSSKDKQASACSSEKRASIGVVDAPLPQSPVLPSSSAIASNGSSSNVRDSCGRAQIKPEWVFAPIPFSNQAFTWGLVPVAAYIFQVSNQDSNSPPSVLIAGGMVADGISWAIAGGGKLYLHNDRFRITVFGGHGTVAYDLFGTGTADGDSGRSVPIRQGGDLALGELLVRLYGKLFLGARYNYRNLRAEVNTSEPTLSLPLGLNPEDIGPDFTTLGPGFKLLQDSRNSTFYPTLGNEFQLYGDFLSATRAASAALPEKQLDYQSYQLSENHYFSLAAKDVLAVRGMLCSVEGEAPFFELCQFGLRGDIRGYQPGRYRDHRMFAVQAEYRRILSRRWGLAAFVGMGEVAPSWNSFTTGNLLPAGGIGGRFNLSKYDRINLRADVAFGRNGWSWNFALAEAF